MSVYTGTKGITNNAAASKVYGGEVSATLRLSPGFTLDGGVSYTHGRYKRFPNAPGNVWDPVTGSTDNSPVDASRHPMIRSPDWTGNLAANYEIEALGGSVLLHSNVYFTSKFYFDPANRNIQPSYALLNARATWTDLSDRYSVAVFMNNITDRAYRTQVLPQGLNTAVSWGLPRMYGVTLGFRY